MLSKQELSQHPAGQRTRNTWSWSGTDLANTVTPRTWGKLWGKAFRSERSESDGTSYGQKVHRKTWGQRTHWCLAVVRLADVIQNHIFDENSHSFQYERHEQIHMDVVSCTVELPENKITIIQIVKDNKQADHEGFKVFIVMSTTGNVSPSKKTLTLLSTMKAKQKVLADSNQPFRNIYIQVKNIYK